MSIGCCIDNPGSGGSSSSQVIIPSPLSPVSDNTAAFTAALVTQSITGQTIFVPTGSWPGNFTIGTNNARIVGAGMPYCDGTTMSGGTIIKGTITYSASGKNGAEIGFLGLDQSGLANSVVDGINLGSTNGFYVHDVACLGRGFAVGASAHAFITQGGLVGRFERIQSFNYDHGCAVRSSRIIGDSIYTQNCEADAVVFKSDIAANTGFNDCLDCAFTNIIALGIAASTSAAIYFNAAGDATTSVQRITVSNVISDGGIIASVKTAINNTGVGILKDIQCNNISSVNNLDNRAFGIIDGDGIELNNCLARNSAGFSYRNSNATNTYLNNCISITPSAGDSFGTWTYAQINNTIVGVAFGTTVFQDTPASTRGAVKIGTGAATADAQSTLYRYSGVASTYYAWQWVSNGQGVKLQGSVSNLAIGSESYTIGGINFDVAGRVGLGGTGVSPTTPISWLTLNLGATNAGRAPMNFQAGALNTTPVSGCVETDSANILFYTSAQGRQVAVMPGPYTVATLPTAAAKYKGARTYVTDATLPTFMGTLTGGGAVVTPVFCDGTTWIAA